VRLKGLDCGCSSVANVGSIFDRRLSVRISGMYIPGLFEDSGITLIPSVDVSLGSKLFTGPVRSGEDNIRGTGRYNRSSSVI